MFDCIIGKRNKPQFIIADQLNEGKAATGLQLGAQNDATYLNMSLCVPQGGGEVMVCVPMCLCRMHCCECKRSVVAHAASETQPCMYVMALAYSSCCAQPHAQMKGPSDTLGKHGPATKGRARHPQAAGLLFASYSTSEMTFFLRSGLTLMEPGALWSMRRCSLRLSLSCTARRAFWPL